MPEFIDEEINNNEVNVEDRDALFREAAEVIVNAQQVQRLFTKKNETWLQQSW